MIFCLRFCVVIWITTVAAYAAIQHNTRDSVIIIDPPLLGFYAKYLDSDGIPIRSAKVVDDKALLVASAKIRDMLAHMPVTRKNLIKAGAELHIIGKDQQTSDLPEFAHAKGLKYVDNGITTDIDARTRGMGGLEASCGEENLLQLPGDRYFGGWDICVHEFSHTIMNFGLDSVLRQKIGSQYKKAVDKGLWKDAYAGSNPQEYWGELSSWYFGAHGEFLKGTNLPIPGAESLKAYDSEGYKLLDSIYSGILQSRLQLKRESVAVAQGAISGISTERSELVLINNKAKPVKLFWIDQSGNAKLYATIPAGKRHVQPTFVSHVWMIEDADRGPLGYIRVNDPPCEIKLTD